MKKLLTTPQEILEEFRTILQLEKKAASVYRQLAQDCDDEEVGQMLERISQEELHHAEIAETLFALAEGFISKQTGTQR
jgi:rubrerythrin